MNPPETLDGATVLFWAWSSPSPFFVMRCSDGPGEIAIHGLAICRYAGAGGVYRFSCDAQWEVENDSPWPSVEDAMHGQVNGLDVATVRWISTNREPANSAQKPPRPEARG